MVSTQPTRLPLLAWRLCCLLWRCSPATFRRGERCASIRWWHCATNDGCAVLQLDWLRADDGQLGSNANVADGIRKATQSDEIRPIIRPWPLPPLRPKRAASGVAGLRYGSGQRKTNHALMAETSAGKPQAEAIPLNIYIHGKISFDALSLSRHTTRRARV